MRLGNWFEIFLSHVGVYSYKFLSDYCFCCIPCCFLYCVFIFIYFMVFSDFPCELFFYPSIFKNGLLNFHIFLNFQNLLSLLMSRFNSNHSIHTCYDFSPFKLLKLVYGLTYGLSGKILNALLRRMYALLLMVVFCIYLLGPMGYSIVYIF